MEILFATHLVPIPPHSGGKSVAWQTLRCLSKLGTVDMCAFAAPWESPVGPEALRPWARAVTILPLSRRSPLTALPGVTLQGHSFYIMRDYSRDMAAKVRRMLAHRYDLAMADSLYMAPYLRDAPLPKLLQAHNAESQLVQEFFDHHTRSVPRWIQQLEVRHLEAFERDSCNAFDAVIVLSETDRTQLHKRGVRAPIFVVPPAVDRIARVCRVSDYGAVAYLGTLHWPPAAGGLRWYIRNVHPLIRAKVPDVETLLAGPRPPRDIQASHGKEGIRVPGYVSDPESVYTQAAVFIVPLLSGGGVRIKIIDALARGLAVVSTSIGCEGLGFVPGRHLLVADEPHAFAEAVVTLLRDRALRERLGNEGRSYVLEKFSPERRCAALARIARAVANGTPLEAPVPALGGTPSELP